MSFWFFNNVLVKKKKKFLIQHGTLIITSPSSRDRGLQIISPRKYIYVSIRILDTKFIF